MVVDVPTQGEASVRLEEGGVILEGKDGCLFVHVCVVYVYAWHLPPRNPPRPVSRPHTQRQQRVLNNTHTGVKARHLETALPPAGGVVLILRGPHRLKKAKCVRHACVVVVCGVFVCQSILYMCACIICTSATRPPAVPLTATTPQHTP